MNTPAGWYDDGQGRKRWWDGVQWTESYQVVQRQIPVPPPPVTTPAGRPKPILGYIGLGLAVIGTGLAFFPITFAVALGVLFLAFVLSLIGIFKRHAPKWPSIVGMVLPPISTVLGFIVVLGIIASGLSSSSGGEATEEEIAPEASATTPAKSEAGPNEFPVGDGYTMEVTIEPLQLEDPTGFQGAAPTEDEYDLYWDNAQDTGGQLAVVNVTVHNRSESATESTPMSINLLKSDLTEVPSWGAIETGYDWSPVVLEVMPGESESWKIGFVLPADEIDTVVVEAVFMEDIGEGNRVAAYQDNRGEGCKQLPPESADDPVKLWSCLQKK